MIPETLHHSLVDNETPNELLTWVVLDSNVSDLKALLEGVFDGIRAFVLKPDEDGVEQITHLLRSATVTPHSLHVISHGAPGTLHLGNSELNLDTLDRYHQQLTTWQVTDLLLYGCNVAAGDAGEEFITRLSKLTGAAISASTTPVGNARQGGNWVLDRQPYAQSIPLAIKASVMSSYGSSFGTLPDVEDLFQLNGSALRVSEDEILLVPDTTNQDGSAFSTARIDFRLDWDFTFNIFLGDEDGGADGLGFVLHNDARGSSATGNDGNGLGIAGVQNAIAIEFDTFRNPNTTQNPDRDEPVADHTAFILNPESGGLNHGIPGNEATELGDIEDGQFHAVVVSWTADSNTLSYSFDGNAIDSIVRDVITEDFAGEELIFWGFGASTGNQTNEHRVQVVEFNGRLVEEDSEEEIVDTTGPEESGPLVFQFEEFVRFEEIADNRPFTGAGVGFNEEVYLLIHDDVSAAVENGDFSSGLEHYVQFGIAEGRELVSLEVEINGLRLASIFDETFYLDENPDVAAAVLNGDFTYGYEHFLEHGIAEGRDPSLYYDEAFYLADNPDVQAAVDAGDFDSGFEHYLLHGHVEERPGATLFDPDDYLLNNPDVVAAIADGSFSGGFDHYLMHGADESRVPTLLYEEFFYLAQNPDVQAAVDNGDFASGFDHYVSFGQAEGRDPGSGFDESAYLDANPDVAAAITTGAFASGMEHFFRFGRQEGRASFAAV